jgi:hypothetical protein
MRFLRFEPTTPSDRLNTSFLIFSIDVSQEQKFVFVLPGCWDLCFFSSDLGFFRQVLREV